MTLGRVGVALLVASGIAFGAGCGQSTPAGLGVIIATNLRYPSEYDGLTVEVSQGTGPDAWAAPLLQKTLSVSPTTLPGTVSIAPGKSPDESALIVVTATKGGKPVVVETRETTIPDNRVAELVIVLSSTCAYVTCAGPGETCQASTGTCGSSSVSSGALPPFNPGDVDHVDAGSLDATIAGDAARESGPRPTDARRHDAGGSRSDAKSDAQRDAGSDGASDSGNDAQRDAGPCSTYYVSMTGSDSNDGCTPSSPLQRILTATTRASAVTGVVPTIEVCAGEYPETGLTIATPMNLMGGYDCTSWTRPQDLGFSSFGGAALTVIENGDVSSQTSTLVLTTGSGTTLVDGFTIRAATTNARPILGSAVVTSVSCAGAGTAPTLSSDVMVPDAPGVWSDATVTSDGVYIGEQATATIMNSSIAAGVGTASAASAGVYVDGTSTVTSLTGDTIAGGAGPGNSFGVWMVDALPDAGALASTIDSSSILGGTGSASYGVWAIGRRSLTLVSSGVELTPLGTDGGAGTCGTGVYFASSLSAVVTGNRIFAQPCDHSATDGVGLSMNIVSSARIYNNMISGAIMSHAGAASRAIAVELTAVTRPDIRFNTLVGGVSVDGKVSSGVSAALFFTRVSGATVADNIFAGESAGDGGLAVSIDCADAGNPLTAFENNVLFNGSAALLRYACPGGYKEYGTMKQALAALGTAGATTGNLTFAASCNPDAGPCAESPSCTNPETCLAAMFAAWSTASYGLPNLASFDPDAGCDAAAGNGWTLSPSAPCQVVQGGAVDAGVTADIYGPSCRSATSTSMGAAEGASCAH